MYLVALFGSIGILLGGVLWQRNLLLGVIGAIAFTLCVGLFSSLRITNLSFILANTSILSVELLLLIFGAFFFFTIQEKTKRLDEFKSHILSMNSVLPPILMLSWFLGSFLEGIAGFGIPSMLVAPIILSLGYRPLTAVVISLAANTISVTFGALGTPLKIGMGVIHADYTVFYTSLLNVLPGIMIPFFLGWLLYKLEKKRFPLADEWKTLLKAGVFFTAPYILASIFSVEFPTVFAGGIGLILFTLFALPKESRVPVKLWKRTFWPYALFIILLIIARAILKNEYFVIHHSLKKIQFFQPGILFIFASIIFIFLAGVKDKFNLFGAAVMQTVKKLKKTAVTIFLLIFLVQLLSKNVVSSFTLILPLFSNNGLIFLAPFLGILGSFLSGSATMSNLLFSPVFSQIIASDKFISLFQAALHTGSSIGNCVSLQNILMVKSTIGEAVEESKVIKWNALLIGLYLFLVSITSFLIYINFR